jgi:adenylate cyclase class IV
MYEIELKVELTEDEKMRLPTDIQALGFKFVETTPQDDYYVEAKLSQYAAQGGKYDLKRYRHEADTYIYTEKVWELIAGKATRRETEQEVSQTDFDAAVAAFPNAARVTKQRDWYTGEHMGRTISFTLDTTKFTHSPAMRYFVEAEIAVEEADDTAAARGVVVDFLKTVLHRSEIVESPGMFTMVYEQK